MAITWLNKEELLTAVQKRLKSADKVLDIGCGIRPQSLIEAKIHICAEPFSEYVEILQNRYAGNPRYIFLHGTADHILSLLPDYSIDTIFLVDVIEHLEKEIGRTIIKECERVARKQIVLFTPIGFMHQESSPDGTDGWGLHGAEWQDHKSGWTPEEFDDSWDVIACDGFHEFNAVGERFDPPIGAFWAIKNNDFLKTDRRFDEKVLFFSHSLPPSPSGQATVLYRLLDGISPDSYCLASAKNYDDASFLQTTTQRLPVRYHWLGRALQIRNFVHPTANRASILLNTLSKIVHDTWSLHKVAREERCRSIVVCTGDACDLPVAYITSLVTRTPLILYYFDYFSEQWAGTPYQGFAKAVEYFIVKRAKGIIVPNEMMRDELAGRYGVDSLLIHNPILSDPPVSERLNEWPKKSGEIRIVYTGSIYRAQSDALKTLLKVVDELSYLNVTLHLYTAQTREDLEKQGIYGSYVLHPHAAYSIIRDVQKEADILYLPLSFDPEISKVIDTSSPVKMGEYLTSGRPVLVHAPSTSYASRYFKENGCGIVVDQNEPEVLKREILALVSDETIRTRIICEAIRQAKVDFTVEKGQSILLDFVNQL